MRDRREISGFLSLKGELALIPESKIAGQVSSLGLLTIQAKGFAGVQ